MSNLRKKVHPESLIRLETYMAMLRQEIEEVEDISDLTDSDAWLKIKGILERKIKSIDFDLENFSVLSDKDIYCSLQVRKDINYFISLIDGGEKALEALNNKLKQAHDRYNELKEKLGS